MEAVARFAADLTQVLPEELNGPLALAVSGGPDSMAMLWLANETLPGRVIAATVDHGLRPESAYEAATVARWCETAGVPHWTLDVTVPPGASGNLQSWARQERYLLLKGWAIEHGAPALATAHHADDQAETFLMRAARGAGLSGLAAVRARLDEMVPLSATREGEFPETVTFTVHSAPLATIRPLLAWRRSELRVLCAVEALPFVDDPSNDMERFDRTRFRRWLGDAPWLDPIAVAQSASYLAEVDRDLREVSRWLHAQRATRLSPDEMEVDVADLPRGVRRTMARIAIDGVRSSNGIAAPAWSWATNIEPLLDALEQGRAATQAGVLATPVGSIWRFAEAPPRRGG